MVHRINAAVSARLGSRRTSRAAVAALALLAGAACAGDPVATASDSGGSDVAAVDLVTGCQSDGDCIPSTVACKVARCGPAGACLLQADADAIACDDGDPCTDATTCKAGVCAGTFVCACQSDADCPDDGDLCNGKPFCDGKGVDAACKVNVSTIVTCDASADTACSVATCDAKTGACASKAVADGGACDDGEPCTAADACKDGVCTGTSSCQCQGNADCDALDDGNPCNGTLFCDADKTCKPNPATVIQCGKGQPGACNAPQCVPADGSCQVLPLADGADCDVDGSSCSLDTCQSGACTPGKLAAPCACTSHADCKPFEDGNACNGTLYCAKPSGHCEINPASVVLCSSAGDTGCVHNLCDPASGACAPTALKDGNKCDDGWSCSSKESCQGGVCTAEAGACQCQSTADCKPLDLQNKCATHYCDKPAGVCKQNPASVTVCGPAPTPACASLACDPKDGACKAAAKNDGGPCEADGSWCTSLDVCQGGICNQAQSKCPCGKDADCNAQEDGDACNGTLYCDLKDGQCKVNPASVPVCTGQGDGPCTPLQCDGKDGACKALPLPDGATCDSDDFVCTVEQCKAGACALVAQGCLCWESSDCAPFEDGDVCNGTLICNKAGGPPFCNKNPASVVTCPAPLPGGCVSNVCDSKDGACKSKPDASKDGGGCDDGDACTSGDACTGGACVGGAAVACDDGNPCTKDSCDGQSGCVAAPTAEGVCDDGNACTGGDGCKAGACVGGAAVACDDGNPCTSDSCDAKAGCVSKDVGGPCNDGNICTAPDVCIEGGTCKSTAINCDDGDACTVDVCDDAIGGCQHAPAANGTVCIGGACAAGVCAGGVRNDRAAALGDASAGFFLASGSGAVQGFGMAHSGLLPSKAAPGPHAPHTLGLPGARELAAGSTLACALDKVGKVHCWGDDGGKVRKIEDVVPGIPTAVSLGGRGALFCVATLAGEAHCMASPGLVPGKQPLPAALGKVVQVEVGDAHRCALLGDGRVVCWGSRARGALGDGKTTGNVAAAAAVPVQVAGGAALTGVTQLALGARFACARTGDNAVWCWGAGDRGQLGGGNADAAVATKVGGSGQGALGFNAVAVHCAAATACAVAANGGLYCWGGNDQGEAGTGTVKDSANWAKLTLPSATPGIAGGRFAAADRAYCAVGSNDAVYCWGSNAGGMLGLFKAGQAGDPHVPSPVLGANGKPITSAIAVRGSGGLLYAMTEINALMWGRNDGGAAALFGDSGGAYDLAAENNDAGDLPQMQVSPFIGCNVAGNEVQCWGDNSKGHVLGVQPPTGQVTPTKVGSMAQVSEVAVSSTHACALNNGAVFCWGDCGQGQCGQGGAKALAAPAAVLAMPAATAIAVGDGRSCALDSKGQAFCWGRTDFGQAGAVSATGMQAAGPIALPSGVTFASISVGRDLSCAITGGGSVYCWGYNGGASGNALGAKSSVAQSTTPLAVSGLGIATGVACDERAACAIRQDGKVYCWGESKDGALGQGAGPVAVAAQPVAVPGVVDVFGLVAGRRAFCAGIGGSTAAQGQVWCWGQRGDGQTGEGASIAATPITLTIP